MLIKGWKAHDNVPMGLGYRQYNHLHKMLRKDKKKKNVHIKHVNILEN